MNAFKAGTVELDRCPFCNGLWFDPGELEQVLAKKLTGTLDQTVAAPRELIKRALDHNAAGLIIAHNHPSGAPEPSAADVAFTKKLGEVCAAMGIQLFDHVIVGTEEHYSFKGHGLLEG
jgi:DNA repair protein RadC